MYPIIFHLLHMDSGRNGKDITNIMKARTSSPNCPTKCCRSLADALAMESGIIADLTDLRTGGSTRYLVNYILEESTDSREWRLYESRRTQHYK